MVSMLPASAVTAFADGGMGGGASADVSETVVAKVGDKTYSTLQEAVTAAKDAGATTVVLQNDTTESVDIPAGANITLDLNGHTIEELVPTGKKRADTIVNRGTLTIEDSQKSGLIESKTNRGLCVMSNSTTTIEYANIKGQEGAIGEHSDTAGATLTINDGKFEGIDNAVIGFNGSTRTGDNTPSKVTINGGEFTGTITSGGYIACGIYAPWKDNFIINNGTFNITNGAGIVARGGTVTVNGGTFNTNSSDEGKVGDKKVDLPSAALVFDDSDPSYPGLSSDSKIIVNNGKFSSDVDAIAVIGGNTERIAVSGGEFSSDPSAFCVTGKVGEKSGNSYVVKNRTYDDVKTDVKPEEKPDTTVNGEANEPVDIDVTLSGNEDEMDCITTVSLNFSDVSAVEKVEASAYGRTISLEKYAERKYQNMPIEELEEAFENAGQAPTALIATYDADSVVNEPEEEEKDELKLTLHVTYNTEGKYTVGVVFKDPNGTEVAKQSAKVQIGEVKSTLTFTDCTATVDGKPINSGDEVAEGKTVTLKLATSVDQMKFGGFVLDPKQDLTKVDDTTATFVMPGEPVTVTVQLVTEDSDDGVDAMTVVAGVAVGAGAAVLTYHIGTEVYAKKVLGEGVAVPKTREEVALKAWELAGKPAVAMDGEPLSEAVQAEKWVVESGLMQNDAEGNFNGSKKMNKLMALRTLDAAKKLG